MLATSRVPAGCPQKSSSAKIAIENFFCAIIGGKCCLL
jgi:hypothetical protein